MGRYLPDDITDILRHKPNTLEITRDKIELLDVLHEGNREEVERLTRYPTITGIE